MWRGESALAFTAAAHMGYCGCSRYITATWGMYVCAAIHVIWSILTQCYVTACTCIHGYCACEREVAGCMVHECNSYMMLRFHSHVQLVYTHPQPPSAALATTIMIYRHYNGRHMHDLIPDIYSLTTPYCCGRWWWRLAVEAWCDVEVEQVETPCRE